MIFLRAFGFLYIFNLIFYDAFVIGGSLLVFCVLASTIIYASLLLLKAKYKVYAVRILFFIGLFAWISAVFFPWGYGELDGLAYPMPINIDGYLHLLILSALLVWCCAIGFKHIDRLLLSIALVVFLCQSTSFVINLFTIDNKLSATSTKNLTEFSQNNKNVIIILLDMYQSNVFQEILDKNYFDNAVDFDGFKYFRNAVSAFPVTVASVPQILTGVSFDNSMTHSEYIEKTFKESSLFKHAYESGFSIAAKPLLYNELLIDGSFNKESGSRDVLFKPLLLDLSKLFDASFFVDLPFLLKNIVYRDGEWFIQNIAASYLSSKNNSNQDGNRSSKVVDIKFVDDFIIDSNAVNEKSTFKFYHLFGNHPPLDLNESIMYEPMDFNLQNSIRQGVGSMKLAVKLLARLKTLGVYDNSMIFIIADHGSGVETKSISGVSGWLARGVPLILAKNYNDHGRIQTSDAPVELSDIGSTISVRNHWVNDFHGLDIFTIKEDITRTRRFINTSNGSLVHGKFEMYEKYDVIGHSWDASSWVYVN